MSKQSLALWACSPLGEIEKQARASGPVEAHATPGPPSILPLLDFKGAFALFVSHPSIFDSLYKKLCESHSAVFNQIAKINYSPEGGAVFVNLKSGFCNTYYFPQYHKNPK